MSDEKGHSERALDAALGLVANGMIRTDRGRAEVEPVHRDAALAAMRAAIEGPGSETWIVLLQAPPFVQAIRCEGVSGTRLVEFWRGGEMCAAVPIETLTLAARQSALVEVNPNLYRMIQGMEFGEPRQRWWQAVRSLLRRVIRRA